MKARQENNEIWLAEVRKTLDRSVEEMDAHTVSRLRSAREQALESRSRKTSLRPAAGLAGFALASLAVVTFTVWFSLSEQDNGLTGLPLAAAENIEILTAADELEFYEDLEFYEWLEGARQHAG